MDTKCGGIAAVRRPLAPRDNNVAVTPSTVLIGKAPKPKPKARVATATPASPPPPPPTTDVLPSATAECGVVAAVGVAEVSLAEELERARERRGRLRAERELTEREMAGRAAALDREAAEWERRAEEQRRLVAELMRLIRMPEVGSVRKRSASSSSSSDRFDSVYTPVESLRSKEQRKRREAVTLAHSASRDSTSTLSQLQGDGGANSCGQESRASVSTAESAKRTEISS
ncbi:hypothetical protein EJB05_34884, partial [Eragrostis curvula]